MAVRWTFSPLVMNLESDCPTPTGIPDCQFDKANHPPDPAEVYVISGNSPGGNRPDIKQPCRKPATLRHIRQPQPRNTVVHSDVSARSEDRRPGLQQRTCRLRNGAAQATNPGRSAKLRDSREGRFAIDGSRRPSRNRERRLLPLPMSPAGGQAAQSDAHDQSSEVAKVCHHRGEPADDKEEEGVCRLVARHA